MKNLKVMFMLSHSPDPRMLRKMNSFFKITNDISVVFWSRSFNLPIPKEFHIRSIEANDSWNIFNRLFIDLKLFFVSLKYLLNIKPTIIYISGFDMIPAGFFYKIINQRIKLVIEIGDLPGGRFSKKKWIRIFNKLINKMLVKADLLVLTSPFFWENYYKNLLPSGEKIFIFENLPLRVLFQNFQPKKHEKLTFGWVGTIRYRKQIEMLFESCKEYENNIDIIVAGMGPDYKYIKEKSTEYHNVNIIGPYNYERDILDIYSKIDVIYSVYDAEDFNVRVAIPNRLYESIVCGLPIIVAKNTALSWVVKKYGVGFEVSSSNVNELKELIKNILNNPDILNSYKENALRIRHNFYYENTEDKFIYKITTMVNTDDYVR